MKITFLTLALLLSMPIMAQIQIEISGDAQEHLSNDLAAEAQKTEHPKAVKKLLQKISHKLKQEKEILSDKKTAKAQLTQIG